jgi:hypothetical protein
MWLASGKTVFLFVKSAIFFFSQATIQKQGEIENYEVSAGENAVICSPL